MAHTSSINIGNHDDDDDDNDDNDDDDDDDDSDDDETGRTWNVAALNIYVNMLTMGDVLKTVHT